MEKSSVGGWKFLVTEHIQRKSKWPFVLGSIERIIPMGDRLEKITSMNRIYTQII